MLLKMYVNSQIARKSVSSVLTKWTNIYQNLDEVFPSEMK